MSPKVNKTKTDEGEGNEGNEPVPVITVDPTPSLSTYEHNARCEAAITKWLANKAAPPVVLWRSIAQDLLATTLDQLKEDQQEILFGIYKKIKTEIAMDRNSERSKSIQHRLKDILGLNPRQVKHFMNVITTYKVPEVPAIGDIDTFMEELRQMSLPPIEDHSANGWAEWIVNVAGIWKSICREKDNGKPKGPELRIMTWQIVSHLVYFLPHLYQGLEHRDSPIRAAWSLIDFLIQNHENMKEGEVLMNQKIMAIGTLSNGVIPTKPQISKVGKQQEPLKKKQQGVPRKEFQVNRPRWEKSKKQQKCQWCGELGHYSVRHPNCKACKHCGTRDATPAEQHQNGLCIKGQSCETCGKMGHISAACFKAQKRDRPTPA
jgi:hypothetical protein